MVKKAAFATKSRALAPSSFATLKRLRASEDLSPEQLLALRDRRSSEIARFAYENTAFYRDFYSDHGLSRADLDDPESFYSLPFLTKDLIRENFEGMRTPEANPRTAGPSVSSGSTGHPLTVLSDLRAPVRAYEWRAMEWWGVEPWQNGATIDRMHRSSRRQLQQQVFWWPTRRILYDTLSLDDDVLDRFIAEWLRVKPHYVVGFIGGVSTVAGLLAARGITSHSPTAVAVTAGPLFEGHRAEMQAAFGAPVYNHYRSTESNWLAAECREQNGLHCLDDIKNLEIINEDGTPAQGTAKGETVFTDFENRVFPLVRYRIGDRTSNIAGDCPCGRPFRRVATIEGRIVDNLVFPSGRVLTGDIFDYFEGCAAYIRQYSIYQGRDYAVEVSLRITDHPEAMAVAEERVGRLRKHVAGDAPVTLKIVEQIDVVRGKFRPIVSDARVEAPTA